ncbi:MAG: hypothetical protein CSA04_02895 [Bacteroidetes bacterium]|nr:MAG: hypothetical protein CSA04_02895 [Bacteroidota bacterium]
MKRLFLTFSLLLWTLHVLFADEVQKTYHFQQPQISVEEGFSLFSFEHTQLTGYTGEPALPYQMVSLLLPEGHEATDITVEYRNPITIPGNHLIAPVQPAQPISKPEKHPFSMKEEVYALNGTYPEKTEGLLSTNFFAGYSIASCAITPLRYNPAKHSVSYFSEVVVTLKTAPSKKALKATELLRSDAQTLQAVQRSVQNAEAINRYSPKKQKDEESYDHLILCPEQFVSNMEPLKALYLKRGLKTQITSLEEIYANMSGNDNQEKIRNYIIQEYTNHGILYVLLGGDVELFPYRGFYCAVQSSSLYEDYNIPSDLYYSALDGTWDDDNDGVWGEIGEDDLLPEVSVARFSFSNSEELTNMIHKTISYQDSPVTGELDSPLLAGEFLYDPPLTWGADYLDLLIGYHEDNGYTTTGIPEEHPYVTLYDREQGIWTKSELINEINQGHSFIHHSGHSNATYAMRMFSEDITNTNFNGVNGVDHNYTLVYTHGCICGAFDAPDCIAEKMVGIANFVVAGAYNSRYGWFNEGQTEGPSAHLHREFIDALYHDRQNHVGEAHLVSRTETSPWVNAPGQHEEGALRWCFYDCNILGDPALAVWTDEPVEITASFPEAMVIGQTSLEGDVAIDGNAQEGYTCALVHEDALYGVGHTDADGHVVISLATPFTEACNATLYISGYNAIPLARNIAVVPGEGAYVVASTTEINDQTGNNNGKVDFGETITLTSTMKNVGAQEASNVTVTISTNDPYLTMGDDTEDFGNIPAYGEVTKEDAFEVTAAANTPDQHVVTLEMNVSDDNNSWQYAYMFKVHAPNAVADEIRIIDPQGNNNGRLDPGETATIEIDMYNSGHAEAPAGEASLETSNAMIQVLTPPVEVAAIPATEFVTLAFEVSVGESVAIGSLADFALSLTSGEYLFQETLHLLVGLLVENFESGDFNTFPWQQSGNLPWEITEDAPFEGTYAAVSGAISDAQESTLSITMDVIAEGEISFFMKVSSEGDYDFLRFFIDNTKKEEWSGAIAWEEHSYTV